MPKRLYNHSLASCGRGRPACPDENDTLDLCAQLCASLVTGVDEQSKRPVLDMLTYVRNVSIHI